ncbi:hypothetical protein ACFQVA_16650 [Actinomadura keratinilytica]
MMDGQVGVIRDALDQTGHEDVAILAYTVKYASAFYGPFREAVGSSLQGDRKTYQQDAAAPATPSANSPSTSRRAPTWSWSSRSPYLDILTKVAEASDVPVAAYQISGEYSMIEAAAQRGWIDRDAAIMESLTGIKRAGAQVILTYWATEVARKLG